MAKEKIFKCAGNCGIRAFYEKNPKSFMGRFWHWHTNFCPGWNGYMKSLPPEEQEALKKKYNLK